MSAAPRTHPLQSTIDSHNSRSSTTSATTPQHTNRCRHLPLNNTPLPPTLPLYTTHQQMQARAFKQACRPVRAAAAASSRALVTPVRAMATAAPSHNPQAVTKKVFFDMEIGGNPAGEYLGCVFLGVFGGVFGWLCACVERLYALYNAYMGVTSGFRCLTAAQVLVDPTLPQELGLPTWLAVTQPASCQHVHATNVSQWLCQWFQLWVFHIC